MRIQTHVVIVKSQEDGSEMGYVLLATIGVRGEVIQIRIGNVFDISKNVGHGPLECGSSIFKAKW